ncbi:MAG: beta-propeller fold lactonase family protein, partial [Verrucomicrobiales bacterium]|nr:beta-propeller fold lactonase family protein [Verrucomicrobiales bacterium]
MKTYLPLALTLLLSLSITIANAGRMPIWIGTGGKNAKGIYKATYDDGSGTLTEPELATEVEGPGWVTLNSDRSRLYAVCKIEEPCVAVWSVDSDDNLTFINSQPIGDGGAA